MTKRSKKPPAVIGYQELMSHLDSLINLSELGEKAAVARTMQLREFRDRFAEREQRRWKPSD